MVDIPVIKLPQRKLDESSPVPLYYQLRELIAGTIEEGEYGPEYKLPSEQTLAETFGLSRMTVRQATSALVNDGVLVRKRGLGTYISPPKVEQGLRLAGFTEDMERRGMVPSTRILAIQHIQATENTARALDISKGDTVIVLERLRFADGEPMAYERCHLSVQRFPDLEEQIVRQQSLYTVLTRKYAVEPVKARQILEATVATGREAELLKVSKGAPLLLLERSTLDKTGTAIEFVKSLYRADRYVFHVELHR